MAFTTTALGLTVWNSPSDKYNYQQLADNWLRVEEHDHTPGKGNRIQTDSIADYAITAEKMAPGVISSGVQARSVGTEAIIDRAVTSIKIAEEAVGYTKMHPYARLPIGTIVPWWHPNPTEATLVELFGVYQETELVPGWVICDGRTLAPPYHDFSSASFTLPNLQSKFIMAASGSGSTESISNLAITACSIGSKSFTLNSSSGLSPNTTYAISTPSFPIFGANTTFTTGNSLSSTNTYLASNIARVTRTTDQTQIAANVSTNPNAATTSGGENTNYLSHAHSFNHTHVVPPHKHSVSATTENTDHTHSAPSKNPFIRQAKSGSGSNSNFDLKSGAKHQYTSTVTTGPMEGKTVFSVTGTAGSSSAQSGDANFNTGLPNTANTSTSLDEVENRPNYIAVMHIMKVKN